MREYVFDEEAKGKERAIAFKTNDLHKCNILILRI